MDKLDIQVMLKEYGVKNEEELFQKLIKDSESLPCSVCLQETIISNLTFLDGDPICSFCLWESEDE